MLWFNCVALSLSRSVVHFLPSLFTFLLGRAQCSLDGKLGVFMVLLTLAPFSFHQPFEASLFLARPLVIFLIFFGEVIIISSMTVFFKVLEKPSGGTVGKIVTSGRKYAVEAQCK